MSLQHKVRRGREVTNVSLTWVPVYANEWSSDWPNPGVSAERELDLHSPPNPTETKIKVTMAIIQSLHHLLPQEHPGLFLCNHWVLHQLVCWFSKHYNEFTSSFQFFLVTWQNLSRAKIRGRQKAQIWRPGPEFLLLVHDPCKVQGPNLTIREAPATSLWEDWGGQCVKTLSQSEGPPRSPGQEPSVPMDTASHRGQVR